MTTRNRDAERQAVEQMRAAVFAHYGEACACCGTTDDLCIDHVEGDGKEQRIALFGLNTVSGRMYRWIIEQGFPEGFQTLCRPCNASKGADGSACRLDHADRERQRREDARAKQAAWRARNKGKGRYVSVEPGTNGAKVLAYLTKHGVTQAGVLADVLGVPIEKAAGTLSGLARAGHIERPAYGRYCLPGQWDQAAQQRRVYAPPPEGWRGGSGWAAGTTWTTRITGLRLGTITIIIGASREWSRTVIKGGGLCPAGTWSTWPRTCGQAITWCVRRAAGRRWRRSALT